MKNIDTLTNYCAVGNIVSLDNLNCLEHIHPAVVVKIIQGTRCVAWSPYQCSPCGVCGSFN